jgi:outer membrane biosynthesis protein TonB
MDGSRRCGRVVTSVGGGVSLALLMVCLVQVFTFSALAQSAPNAQNQPKTKRKVLVMVQPDYPYILRNGHFEGQVKLEATVQPNGSVSKVDPKGGNPMLAQYAQLAVMKWKYAPGPAQTVEEVVFSFSPTER